MDFAAAMPLAGTLGVTIEEGSKERIAGKLPVRPEICTAGGIVHGGAIMAFADCLGAVGAFLTLPEGASGTLVLSPGYKDIVVDGMQLNWSGTEKARSLLAPGRHSVTFRISRTGN